MQPDRGVITIQTAKFGRPIKVMLVPDLHIRDRDFSTVKNSSIVGEWVFRNIMQLAREQNIDVIIFLGDLTDCGYQSEHLLLHHNNMFRTELEPFLIAAGIFGNHMFIERDSNLEYYLFQPHPQIQSNSRFQSNKPVLKNPSAIMVDNIQFSLFNYDRLSKDYTYPRLEGCSYNIGLYHDDSVLPSEVSQEFHIQTKLTSSYMNSIYSNVNEAVLAHIHKPYSPLSLYTETGEVTVYIPGSATITENSDKEKHDTVDLHVYEIFNNKMSHTITKASTGIEGLEFITSRAKEKQNRQDFSTIDGEAIIRTDDIGVMEYTSSAYRRNLHDFMRKRGYTEHSLDILKLASSLALDFNTAYAKFEEANNRTLLEDEDIDG